MQTLKPDARPLSDREADVLAYLRKYMGEWGKPPTTREIARACHIASTSNAHDVLVRLERRGYLRLTPDIARGIRLYPLGDDRCPYCGGDGKIKGEEKREG